MTTRTKETRQDTQVTLWPKMMLVRVADAHLGSFRNANSHPTQALHRGPGLGPSGCVSTSPPDVWKV